MLDDEILANFKKKPTRRQVGYNDTVSPCDRKSGTIGLELEIEGERIPVDPYVPNLYGAVTSTFWNNIKDGSLRNGGREFVLNTPCTEEEVAPLLEGLFSYFKKTRTTINNSNRCSTHVHINVGGYKVHQISAIIALWYIFEDALINWWDERRKTNHFCLALKDTKATYEIWNRFVQTGYKPHLTDGLKYSALNILPVWTQGSLEFRCGDGVDEPTRPIMWTIFLNSMANYAVEHFSNPSHLAQSASEINPEGIFYSICDREELRDFARQVIEKNPHFNDSCMASLRDIQGLLLGHDWEDIIEKANRVKITNPFGKQKTFDEVRFAGLRVNSEFRISRIDEDAVEPEEQEDDEDEE